jgi:hypothetical protein
MTHYWDCCKLSCSWPDAGSDNTGGALVKACGGGPNDQSSCGNGPDYACTSQLPWVDDGILYGFVANQDTGSKADCGTCFELQLTNAGVQRAIVQVTNKGGMGSDQHGKAVFDFLVPGGGFGEFTGCSNVPGWKVYTNQGGPCSPYGDSPQCARYGGFKNDGLCDTAFPGDAAARKACKDVLFGVFPAQSGNFPGDPIVIARRTVSCPAALVAMSGVDGIKQQTTHDWSSFSNTTLV